MSRGHCYRVDANKLDVTRTACGLQTGENADGSGEPSKLAVFDRDALIAFDGDGKRARFTCSRCVAAAKARAS